MESHIPEAVHSTAAFFSAINHPIKFRLYLLKNLPGAFFSRLKIIEANHLQCAVSVSYRWATRNPFRSTYFACLCMAAELSTGVLAMAQVYGHKLPVSLLVTGLECRFYKKATGLTVFRCAEGYVMKEAVEKAIATGEGQAVKVLATGTNEKGEKIADCWLTWSFKVKENRRPQA